MQELETKVITPIADVAPKYHAFSDASALRQHVMGDDCDDLEEIIVEIPQWETSVLVISMTATERAEFIEWRDENRGLPNYEKHIQFHLISMYCLHPESRTPFLKAADEQFFMKKRNGAIIELLWRTVTMISKLDGSVIEDAKKNLERARHIATHRSHSD